MILVIGSNGMLGTDFVDELNAKNILCKGWDVQDIDITKQEDMKKILALHPSVIVNCAAYTNVDKAETEKELAYQINVIGPKNLAEVAHTLDIPIVQISTDYVFNGEEKEYFENDKKDPINYYGLTKSLGEDEVIRACKKRYIVRTSWLFGRKGKNFVETMKTLAQQKSELRVVDDQHGRPTYTRDLANAIIEMIEQKLPFGIYHCTNSNTCTWFEFAHEIITQYKYATKVIPCTSDEYKRDAKRPQYSVLVNTKTKLLRSWKVALASYREE